MNQKPNEEDFAHISRRVITKKPTTLPPKPILKGKVESIKSNFKSFDIYSQNLSNYR